MSAGLQSLGRLWGENPFPDSSSFWGVVAFLGWWPHGSNLQGQHLQISAHDIASSSACHIISLCLPLIRVHVIAFRTDPGHPGPSLHLQSPFSSCKVTVRFHGLGHRSFWGGCYSAYPKWSPTVPPLYAHAPPIKRWHLFPSPWNLMTCLTNRMWGK